MNILQQYGSSVVELVVQDCFMDEPALKALLTSNVGNVRVLDVSHNKIAIVKKQSFELQALQVLNLSHNIIIDLPRTFADTDSRVTQLDLSHNLITALYELSLPDDRALVMLDLSHNPLSTFRGDHFFDTFNISRLTAASLRMESSPSHCRMQRLPLDTSTVRCNCGSGLRNVPGCPATLSCDDSDPNATRISHANV